MDYSDDSCMTEFTPGQTVAMIASYIELRAVPGSIMEVEDNDESHAPANNTSDNLSHKSETTVSNNVDDGSEPLENEVNGGMVVPPESDSFDSSTSENTSTDNSSSPQSSNGGFSTILTFSQSASSDNIGGSGLFFPQNNAGTTASQSSIFGSIFGSGGGGGGDQELIPSGFDYVAPTAGIFTLSPITVDAAPSPVAASSQACGASLKAKGELCSSDLQCCSGVCAGIFFFDKCA
jgi:hypothetical protein